MPSHCSICRHYEIAKQVNHLLIERKTPRQIVKQFPSLGYRSIYRHAKKCLAKRLALAWQRREILLQIDTESHLTDLAGLKSKLQKTLAEIQATDGNLNGIAAVAREIRGCVTDFVALERLAAEAEVSSGMREVEIYVVYDEEKNCVDLPAPERFNIVREPRTLEAARSPAPMQKAKKAVAPSACAPTGSASMSVTQGVGRPEGWPDVLSGNRRM